MDFDFHAWCDGVDDELCAVSGWPNYTTAIGRESFREAFHAGRAAEEVARSEMGCWDSFV